MAYIEEVLTNDPVINKYASLLTGADSELKFRIISAIYHLKKVTNADVMYIFDLKSSTSSRILSAMQNCGMLETQNIMGRMRWYHLSKDGQELAEFLLSLARGSRVLYEDYQRITKDKEGSELPYQKLQETIYQMKQAAKEKRGK